MEIIRVLGNKLAKLLKISPIAARGLIKLAIKEELDPFKPLNQIAFNDLKLVIKNALRKRLIDLKISKVDFFIELILNELIKNRSLITIEKV
ncbi:MAG: hypothetical protein ACTSQJ_18380 [Promethearchaeota archaeon]